MKRTHFLILALIFGASIVGASKASAETIDGTNSADVQINGSVGKLDNTDPTTNIPEGSDEWINVTVDTTTAFHTTTASSHKTIASADYSIANNSGRAVAVTLSQMAGTPKYVETLAVNVKGTNLIATPSATNLVASNALVDLSSAPVWLRLANKDGRFNISSDTQNQYGNAAEFYYTGQTVANLPADVNQTATAENYTLTLKFASIQADGTTVGVTQ